MRAVRLALVAAAAASAARVGDRSVSGVATQYLDGDSWVVTGPNVTFGGIVPGDILVSAAAAWLMVALVLNVSREPATSSTRAPHGIRI